MKAKYIAILLALCLSYVSTQVFASDKNGAFAVKGAGISNCAHFVETSKKKDELYFVYGGWIEGYLTATNQHQKQTFDLAPWQSTQLLLKVIESFCIKNPKAQFHQALNLLATEMSHKRIDQGTKFIDIDGKRNFVFQEHVIRSMKQALSNKNFYTGPIDSKYDAEIKLSMKNFQKSTNQKQTGLPDQGTLFELFKP